MIEPRAVDQLASQLFSESYAQAFAILDGASVAGLDLSFAMFDPQYACLLPGEVAPDMAEVAPYLVLLQEGDPFTQWLLSHGWGHHWGIFGSARAGFSTLRRHFRKFVLTCDDQGKTMYFRYYDPRVLQIYLPTCNEEELREFFGPVVSFIAENGKGSCTRLLFVEGMLREEPIPLSPLGPSSTGSHVAALGNPANQ